MLSAGFIIGFSCLSLNILSKLNIFSADCSSISFGFSSSFDSILKNLPGFISSVFEAFSSLFDSFIGIFINLKLGFSLSLGNSSINSTFDVFSLFISCGSVPFIILSISSSALLTVNLSDIILFNNCFCCCLSVNFNNDLACLSDIFSFRRASCTSSSRFNSLNLLATVDWVFPSFVAKASCVIYPMSNIFLYDIASSIGVRFSLCTFSINATSALSLSFKSVIMAGIVFKFAMHDALYLLSPAIISNLSPIGLTTIGWITPCSFIDFESSIIASSLNFILGWNLLGNTSSIFNSTTFFPLVSIIKSLLYSFIII